MSIYIIQNNMIHNIVNLKTCIRINIYKKDYEKKWTSHYHSKTRHFKNDVKYHMNCG